MNTETHIHKMNKPNIEDATRKELIAYMAYQDSLLNGVTQLEQQISRTCSLLSSDLEKINTGNTDGLIILSLADSMLKKLMFTIKNKDFFIGTPPEGKNTGKVVEMEVISETKEIVNPGGNPFEEVSKKIKANLNGSK